MAANVWGSIRPVEDSKWFDGLTTNQSRATTG
jgi:hypothetical protein